MKQTKALLSQNCNSHPLVEGFAYQGVSELSIVHDYKVDTFHFFPLTHTFSVGMSAFIVVGVLVIYPVNY